MSCIRRTIMEVHGQIMAKVYNANHSPPIPPNTMAAKNVPKKNHQKDARFFLPLAVTSCSMKR